MKLYTTAFLDKCVEHGIKCVSIDEITKLIPSSIGHACSLSSHSVYAEERDEDGWPAIWTVVECFPGMSAGAGNCGQHQITASAYQDLDHGVFTFTDGVWKRA